MADAVMRTPGSNVRAPTAATTVAPAVQRLCTACEEGLSQTTDASQTADVRKPASGCCAGTLQRAQNSTEATRVSPVVAASIRTLQGGGSALPPATRAFFEPRFGTDFSHVRVHTGSRAEETAKAISAKAFTVGADIAFAGGEYAPESPEGQHLLAHELTHVVQQSPMALRREVERPTTQAIPQVQCQSTGVTVQRDLVDDISDAISGAASSAASTVSDLASDAVDVGSGVIDSVKNQLEQALDTGLGQINGLWAVVRTGAASAVDGAIQQASGFLSGIGALFEAVGTALRSLDVDSLRAVWGAITGTADAALAGVRGLVAQTTATLDGLWLGLKGLANRVVEGLRATANGLIGRLPGAVQGLARSLWSRIEARLTNAWKAIESEWLSVRESAVGRVNQLVAVIATVVTSLKNSVITVIIDTLDRTRHLFTFLKQVMANPDILIDPMVKEIIGRLRELPEKSRGYVQTKVRENAAAGLGTAAAAPLGGRTTSISGPTSAPAATTINRVIQRSAAPAGQPRSTLGVGDVIAGCWDFITDKIKALWARLGATVKEMVLSLIWPPATWEALKKDWTLMTGELSTRVSRLESIRTDSWNGFSEDLERYLSNLADFPLIVWRAANAMLGHLSVYIGLAIVLGGAIAGAIAVATGGAIFGSVVPAAGTAAGATLGLGAGFMAGAAAGYAVAETVGLILLASFVASEQLSILKSLNDLLGVPQSEEEQKEDFSQVADSTIAILTALLLMAIAFVGVALAKRVWAFVKSIPGRLVSRPKPAELKPADSKPVEPAKPKPGSVDSLVICRVCDVVPGVPGDLMTARGKLSPEMRTYLDSEAAKIFSDPAHPTPENFKALREFMADAAKQGSDLESGLRNKLASQNVGSVTAPIDFDGHITRGEVKPNGQVVGGHSTATGEVKIVPGSERARNALGVYEAKVTVLDPANPGHFVPKTNNGGYATLFPDNWSSSRIKVEVDAAFKTKAVSGNTWTGTTPSGVKVRGFLSPKTTVFPVL
jgi:hypothetical protein